MLVSRRMSARTVDGRLARSGGRRHRWVAGTAAIVVVALAAVGCSGGSSKGVSATATTTTTTTQAGARSNQAFTQCMQSHGVTVTGVRGLRGGSTPSSLPAGVTAAQYQQAFQACRSQLPAGGQNFLNNPAFAAYRNCLTLHGVTVPQPGQGGGGPPSTGTAAGGQGFGGLDRTNPTVQAALQACAALRPTGGTGASTTTPAA